MNAPAAASGKDLLARIQPKLKVSSTMICLRPDLIEEWTQAHTALTQRVAEERSGRRLAGGSSKATVDEARVIADLEQQIEESQVEFTMRALDKPTNQLLKDRCPPRPQSQLDMFAGYNVEAYRDERVRLCLLEPVFDDCLTEGCEHLDCGTWQNLELVLAPSEWDELMRLADEVNGRVSGAPKSELVARLLGPRSTAPDSPSSGE